MIDRSKAPEIKEIEQPKLPDPVIHQLDNGIKVYEVNLGSQDVVKVEVVFKAGRWYEDHKLIAKATSQLLKAGTVKYNAEQLAHVFEYYGAKLKIHDGFSTVNLVLYCLSKHLERLLPVLYEIVTEPVFPEEELHKFIKRNAQNLRVQLQKSDIVAYRVFTEELFGKDHPYGYNSSPEIYQQVDVAKIRAHFEKCYTANNCTLFLAGKTSPSMIKTLNQYFGKLSSRPKIEEKIFEIKPQPPFKPIYQQVSEKDFQVSIRIGRRTFNRKHEDWSRFYMMNMVLGGYFGARLMQNLRERNGFTYGVYSSMETLLHSGYWYIHSDVGKDVKTAALTEIYTEIERLQNELVPAQELEMVRNYSLGMLLTSLDGVFNVMSVVKAILISGLDKKDFYKFVDTIRLVTAEEIRETAQKYLQKEDLLEVVVE